MIAGAKTFAPLTERLVHLQRRRTAPLAFDIAVVRADGSTDQWRAIGGTSAGHTLTAIDQAGLGGVVRVRPMTELEAA